MVAGRLSYIFGLKGSSVSIDTACSSSLVSVHYGAKDVVTGLANAALAAGVSVTLTSIKSAAFAVTGGARNLPHACVPLQLQRGKGRVRCFAVFAGLLSVTPPLKKRGGEEEEEECSG